MSVPRALLSSNSRWSSALKDEFQRLVGLRKPLDRARALYIPTAAFASGGDETWAQVQAEWMVNELGLAHCDVVDLAEVEDEKQLQLWLVDDLGTPRYDVIYVGPGNTFYLAYHSHRLGMPQLIMDVLEEGIVYVGESAGSICAGATVATALWKGWDDPHAPGIPQGWSEYFGAAFKLVPNNASIFPHHSEEYEDLVNMKKGTIPVPVVTITDDQAIIIEGGCMKMLGGEYGQPQEICF